jgi:hypothetical protein
MDKSYEERMIEQTNKRVDALEVKIGNAPVIEKIVDSEGNLKSIQINRNGLQVERKF